MNVVVKHRITDPEQFFSGDPEEIAANAPDGVEAKQFFPSVDRSEAVCLWGGPSIDAVREYIDSVTGDSAENTYFEVSAEFAMGLPEAAGASA
ncbi:MAG: hypothetical protein ABR581_07310 [Thermoleophilaceae bacterium]